MMPALLSVIVPPDDRSTVAADIGALIARLPVDVRSMVVAADKEPPNVSPPAVVKLIDLAEIAAFTVTLPVASSVNPLEPERVIASFIVMLALLAAVSRNNAPAGDASVSNVKL